MVFVLLLLTPHPYTCVFARVAQPCELISARSARVYDHFFTVDFAGHCDDLLSRQNTLDREQLLWRHSLLRSPVAGHRDGDAVTKPSALHRVKRRHGRTAKCVLETWL